MIRPSAPIAPTASASLPRGGLSPPPPASPLPGVTPAARAARLAGVEPRSWPESAATALIVAGDDPERALLESAAWALIQDLPEGWRGEILRGRLHLMPGPAVPHARASSGIQVVLAMEYLRRRGRVPDWLFATTPRLLIPEALSMPEPDLAAWRVERVAEADFVGKHVRIMPDWVCEILSPSTAENDRTLKRSIYFQAGIPFYWIVDAEARSIEVYGTDAAHPTDYALLLRAEAGETLILPPFEVEVPVLSLFTGMLPSMTAQAESGGTP